ncbi:MAG: hypothetical protein PWP37_1735 [Thermotogota bacterium]|nr:hypothetical protein [Thermotogota bacterium]
MDSRKRARLLNNRANELLKSGKYNEAFQLYMEALRVLPNMPEIHYNAGVALTVMERFNEARMTFYKAKQLGLDVKTFPVDLYLAFCEAKVGNLDKAKKLIPELQKEPDEKILSKIEELLKSRYSEHDKKNDGKNDEVSYDQGQIAVKHHKGESGNPDGIKKDGKTGLYGKEFDTKVDVHKDASEKQK